MLISKHRGIARALTGGVLALAAVVTASAVQAAPTPRPQWVSTADPSRVLDTRTGIGAPKAPLVPGGVLRLNLRQVRWDGGDVVAFNLTATDAGGDGWVRAWPCSEAQPTTSIINYVPAHPSANLVVLKLTSDEICFASSTSVNLIADLTGYADSPNDLAGSSPYRLLDTRQPGASRLAPNAERRIKVAGFGGIPGNAGVAALNFTVVTPSQAGYVTAYECATTPNGSTVNFGAGEVVANMTLVELSGGDVCFRSSVATDIIVDSYGYSSGTQALRVQSPTRIVDTRQSWWPHGQARSGSKIPVPVAGRANVPTGAESALLNITVANASGAGYVTVWPSCDDAAPNVSTVNTWPDNLRSNLVLVKIEGDGMVCVQYTSTNGSPADLIVDAVGWNPWGPGRSNLPSGFPQPSGAPVAPAPAPVAAPATFPAPSATNTGRFNLLPPGSALPSGAECADRIRSAAEKIPGNTSRNHTTWYSAWGQSSYHARADGNYTGTTDEIIQWAACKWGMDEDVLRAQTYQESRWSMDANGDRNPIGDGSQCIPAVGGYNLAYAGVPAGKCAESIGLMQVRTQYYRPAAEGAVLSTAYNVDISLAVWRECYEGQSAYLARSSSSYHAGDMWGCIGRWFTGQWYNGDEQGYIALIQQHLANRAWQSL